MSNLLKHKKALYEIFEAKMVNGESLYGNCDIIIKNASTLLPDTAYQFITLSDFIFRDPPLGGVKDKFVVVLQDIVCGSVVKDEEDGEAEAEFRAYTLARLVRTILKNNRTLVSTSYPDGISKESKMTDSLVEPVMYTTSKAFIVTISLLIKMKEEN